MAAKSSWSLGLKNHAGMYLTAEPFGFSLFCNSKSLKKKQTFEVEQQGNDIFIRTHLGRYLSFKEDGKVQANASAKGQEEALSVECQDDGRWALKTKRGYYFGGAGENLDAFTKELKADRLWGLQIVMHPQICLRNMNRKRYVHLSESDGKLTTDEDIPWGSDALLNLVYQPDGKIVLQAFNGLFLSETGDLKEAVDASCQFTLEFVQQAVAFRGASKKYLSATGASGVLKVSRDGAPGKDELFEVHDSHPQFTLKSNANQQFASIRRGLEIHCNQATPTDAEIFQLEINPETKQWSLRTHKNQFWSVQADGTIHVTASESEGKPVKRGPNEWFTASWLGPQLALKAVNGSYVSVKKNGQLVAAGTALSDESTFTFELVNRPKLVLRGEHGFVASLPSGQLEGHRLECEVFTLNMSGGYAKLSAGQKDRFWKVGASLGVHATGDEPDLFTLEFVEHSKVAIKAPNGLYLQGQHTGSFTASGKAIDNSTLWEY